ncbi:hypothetical protein DSECCO2_529010 [anaerobic digester metagenome]
MNSRCNSLLSNMKAWSACSTMGMDEARMPLSTCMAMRAAISPWRTPEMSLPPTMPCPSRKAQLLYSGAREAACTFSSSSSAE